MLALGRVVRAVRSTGERAGLDIGSDAVLFAVAHSSDGIRISDVAEHLHLDLSTVSRHVTSLSNSGYVVKAPDPDDGRACRLIITESGSDVLRRLMEQRGEVFAAATSPWPAGDTALLADLLERLAVELTPHHHAGAAHDHQ